MRNYLFLILLLISFFSFSQKTKKKDTTVAQLFGITIDADSLYPIPGVRVYVKNTTRGDVSKYNGCFGLPVLHKDTVIVKCFSYRTMKFIVPDTGSHFEIVFKMKLDTFNLPAIEISILPTEQQFIQEVLNSKIQFSDYYYAVENLDPNTLRQLQTSNVNYNLYLQSNNLTPLRNYGMTTIPVIDPLAWRRAIKDYKNYKKQKEEELKKYKSDSSYE